MMAAINKPPLAEVVPFPTAPAAKPSHRSVACQVAEAAFARAPSFDEDGAFPAEDVIGLHRAGLLMAVIPPEFGGAGLGDEDLNPVLQIIGFGSLPLGRLFEGHVNAMKLVLQYGRREQIEMMANEALNGQLLGVWNTDDVNGLRLVKEPGGYHLLGRKILASGAGYVERPIVTATDEDGRRLMIMPLLRHGERADLSGWTALGMKASATGAVDFSGVSVRPIEILGNDGDYERQPFFSGGAWRFAAVHVGGMARLFDLLRDHLRRTGRGQDPHQAARLGQAAIAVETARLWIERAASIAEGPSGRTTEAIVAYVNLARLSVERAALDLMELIHRSIGLQSFMRPNPIDRISRDLATYLRQPAPDRALTDAAGWLLEQEQTAVDPWP
jgi:alkylation response protein AidB-like acyl-CoA dehydrogenase